MVLMQHPCPFRGSEQSEERRKVNKVTSNKDRLQVRRFFARKGLEYLESNKPTGQVQQLIAKLRSYVQDQIQSPRMARLKIAFINPHIGYGCFADEPIASGHPIGEYTGLLVARNTGRHDSHYAIQVIPEEVRNRLGQTLYLSAAKAGNELRFINHLGSTVHVSYPDGRTAIGPNARLVRSLINGQPTVHLIATRDILVGDEIRIQYHWANSQFRGGRPSNRVYHYTELTE